jgi:hypothetical protein
MQSTLMQFSSAIERCCNSLCLSSSKYLLASFMSLSSGFSENGLISGAALIDVFSADSNCVILSSFSSNWSFNDSFSILRVSISSLQSSSSHKCISQANWDVRFEPIIDIKA